MNGGEMTTAEYRAQVHKGTSEGAFMAQIIGMARAAGWLVHHCRPVVTKSGRAMTPIQGDGGFPDLAMVWFHPDDERHDLAVVAELKSWRGRSAYQPGQEHWIDAWRAIEKGSRGYVRAFVWTPMDWDEIERVLERRE